MSVHLKPAFSPDTEKGYVIEAVFPSLTRRNSSKIEISLFSSIVKEENYCLKVGQAIVLEDMLVWDFYRHPFSQGVSQ